ncbi:MAG: RHS repeat-associated core domain-containing protein [Ignavibacteria bacterium]|nr:RHS repeat-associated core domain-containing protein [Ignavibacteria bacterium]
MKDSHGDRHLGNVRCSFRVNNTVAEVTQEDMYYPFGLSYRLRDGGQSNRYLYNGKEQESFNKLYWNDYSARFYDSQLGRWHVTDPADQFHSPYVYCANNPVNRIDPDGCYDDNYMIAEDGTIAIEKTADKFDQFFLQIGDGSFQKVAVLMKNDNGLINIPADFRIEILNGEDHNFRMYCYDKEAMRFVRPDVFAAVLGAAWYSGISTFGIGDGSSASGNNYITPGNPRHSHHKDGRNLDIRPIRDDESGDRVLVTDPAFSYKKSSTFAAELHKFGFTSILLNPAPIRGQVPYTKQCAGHSNHFHVQGLHVNHP